jgi:hypothetical protein
MLKNNIENSAKTATRSFSNGQKYNIELVIFGLESLKKLEKW